MTRHGRNGDRGVGGQPQEQSIEEVEEALGRFDIRPLDNRCQPLQVDTVAENFFMIAFDHYRGGLGLLLHLVQGLDESI